MPAQLLCNTLIDYSSLPGSVLPFTVQLDLVNSILTPALGEYQRFCYIVTGVGSDTSEQKNLSHWVLGICDQITEGDIIQDTITVVIGSEPQTVIFGTNVVLGIDPTTGCSGLKFDFGLNKISGTLDSVMQVCFELTSPYTVGPNLVCLKGGTTTESGLSICGPSCGELPPCETFTYQTATVCVPVTVTPTAVTGTTRTMCCGDPIVTPGAIQCPSSARTCHFTISQQVCIEVPVTFGAVADVGKPHITCESTSSEGCSCD